MSKTEENKQPMIKMKIDRNSRETKIAFFDVTTEEIEAAAVLLLDYVKKYREENQDDERMDTLPKK